MKVKCRFCGCQHHYGVGQPSYLAACGNCGLPMMADGVLVAVLSTTVLPLDGIYRVETLPPGEIPSLSGVPHYIGHPDTKAIVEGLGAVPAPTKLFAGLQPGEQAICFPIAQGRSTRATEGFTSPHQDVSLEDLQIRVITRLE